MRGLLVKDLKLLKTMKNSLVMVVLIAAVVAANTSDASFVTAYLAFIGATFAAGTISYDEADNGYAFLFSLPVARRGYTLEKYLFGLCVCGGGWLIGSIISAAAGMIRGTAAASDAVMTSLATLPVVMILLALLLPFQLKFGGEKGRIVMIGAIGLLFVVCLLGARLAKALEIDLSALEESIEALGLGTAVAGAAFVGLAMLLLSCRISMGIMEKKEF